VAGCVAAAAAAASGGSLPDDRASGKREWLATLSLRPPLYRAGPAVAGVLVATLSALAVATVGAASLLALGLRVETHAVRSLTSDARARTGSLPADLAAGSLLELDLRPIFRDPEATVRTTVPGRVAFEPSAAGAAADSPIPVRGAYRVAVPSGARSWTLVESDPVVDLRVAGARAVGDERPFLVNVLLAGLLLGLGLSCVVPVAVLVSRATSAPTAAGVGALLALLGVARPGLLALAADLAGARGGALPSSILRGACALAPDLGVLLEVDDVALGRFLSPAAFAALLPALLHAAVCLAALVAWPSRVPRR
jgi:hypothetical protein